MARIDFPVVTKRIIAERAAFRCSFPGCAVTTSAPGAQPDQVSRKGEAAHIFSAAEDGPRGRGGLADDEIAAPENGIWLCESHGKLIDNNNGADFPAEVLLSYKALHEARIKAEHLGLYPPMGWIHEIQINQSPIFASGAKVTLAKLNLLVGANMTGKTALCEYLIGAFTGTHIDRWRQPSPGPLDVRVTYLRPNPATVRFRLTADGKLRYEVEGKPQAFNSLPIRIIRLPTIVFSSGWSLVDDRKLLAETLSLEPWMLDGLIEEIHAFSHARVRNLRFELADSECNLVCDLDGTVPGLSLRGLSGREVERVFIEFATAAARVSGRYCPTILVLDNPFILFDGWFDFYSHHLLDPENQFQTIMCIPTAGAGGCRIFNRRGPGRAELRAPASSGLSDISRTGGRAIPL